MQLFVALFFFNENGNDLNLRENNIENYDSSTIFISLHTKKTVDDIGFKLDCNVHGQAKTKILHFGKKVTHCSTLVFPKQNLVGNFLANQLTHIIHNSYKPGVLSMRHNQTKRGAPSGAILFVQRIFIKNGVKIQNHS